MTRDRFRDHREEMERMRRRRERMEVLFLILLAFTSVFGLGLVFFMLTHPEAIGWFVGRVVAGAESVK